MNVQTFRKPALAALLLVALPAFAQDFRFIWQGTAYYAAENRILAERVVDDVVGTSPGSDAQVIFFRGRDEVPGDLSLNGRDGALWNLPSGSYVALAVPAGNHVYDVDGQALQLQVAPGERRYVRIGDDNANARIRASNAQTFLRMVTGDRDAWYASK